MFVVARRVTERTPSGSMSPRDDRHFGVSTHVVPMSTNIEPLPGCPTKLRFVDCPPTDDKLKFVGPGYRLRRFVTT